MQRCWWYTCVVLSAVAGCCLLPGHSISEPRRLSEGTTLSMPIINLLGKPSCSGDWQEAASMTRTIVGLMIAGATFMGLLFLTATLAFDIVPCRKLENWKKLVLFGELVVSLLVGWSMSKAAMMHLPPDTHWHVFLPEDWHEVFRCTYIHRIGFPESFLPLHAGADLPAKEKTQRMEYYLSLLLWLTLGAFLSGNLITLVARAHRAYRQTVAATRSSREYQLVDVSEDSSDEASSSDYLRVPLWFHLGLHIFYAALAISAALSNRMDTQDGVCWEVYVFWLSVQLGGSIITAIGLCCSMPSYAAVPNFAGPIVIPVLPVVGEPLDVFKDWLFVGLAISRGTSLSLGFAGLAVGILICSNVHMRHHYEKELAWFLTPVQQVCIARRKESFLARNTSPVKLALALTEDLPQACVQSLFVAVYGGSSTQVLFIALSCVKILACVVLRAMVLESEDRYGEAFEAKEFYYRVQYSILSSFLQPDNPWTLHSQRRLADSLYQQGRHLEEIGHREEAVAICRAGDDDLESLRARSRLACTLTKLKQHLRAVEILEQVVKEMKECGPRSANLEDTLWFQDNLAVAYGRVGKHQEALKLKRQVVQTRCEEFEPNHPHTLWSQSSLAKTLADVGEYQESLEVAEKFLKASLEILGENHPDTLWVQDNMAITLGHLGRHHEALEMKQEVLKRKMYFGPKHKYTLWSTGSVADSLLALGEVEEALKLRKREVKDRQKIHGIIFADTIEAQIKLAKQLIALGHQEEAIELQDKVLKVSREALGPGNPDTLRLERTFADIIQPGPTEIWSFFSGYHMNCGDKMGDDAFGTEWRTG